MAALKDYVLTLQSVLEQDYGCIGEIIVLYKTLMD